MIQGNRIRQVREQRALSQDSLGKLVAKDAHYISKVERGVLVSMTTTTLERLVQALHVSADYLLGLSDQAAPAAGAPTAVASQHQAKPTAATSARHAGRTTNGTHPTPAPAPASAAQPEPSRSSAMCPHCAMPMQPLGDGHGLACPACRYTVAGAT